MRQAVFLLFAAVSLYAELAYQKAPEDVRRILDAPATPVLSVSPTGTHIILCEPLRYPPVSEVGAPFLRLAGVRINPVTNGRHLPPTYVRMTLRGIADGKETTLAVPAASKPGTPRWNQDGSLFAFTAAGANSTELWLGTTATGQVRRVPGVRVNAVLNGGIEWLDDGRTLLIENRTRRSRRRARASVGPRRSPYPAEPWPFRSRSHLRGHAPEPA